MTDWDLISSYAGLLVLATTSIYTGSFGSLPRRKNATSRDEEEEEEEEESERMSSSDAMLFPILASVMLLSIYLIYRYFGPEWIDRLLRVYFCLAALPSVPRFIISLSKLLLGATLWRQFDRVIFSVKKGSKEITSLSLRTPSLFLIPLGGILPVLYTFWPAGRKSIILLNLISLSYSYTALCLIKLDSFRTGCILLSGLFAYDIWWVFGTEVMVKVARSIDGPIKLLWPKSLYFSLDRGCTMLGLGDIVIPGSFIALSLRYDYHRASAQGSRLAKSYFYASIAAYAVGLATCMAIMHQFKTAQPALLYLSPACILSFFAVAVTRGELSEAWAWSDAPVDSSKDTQKQEKPASSEKEKSTDDPSAVIGT